MDDSSEDDILSPLPAAARIRRPSSAPPSTIALAPPPLHTELPPPRPPSVRAFSLRAPSVRSRASCPGCPPPSVRGGRGGVGVGGIGPSSSSLFFATSTVLTPAEDSLHDQTNLLPTDKLHRVFLTLALSILTAFIDQNGPSVALPTIATSFSRSSAAVSTISWAATSSLIANTTFQMLYGRLSDIFGRKIVFLAAIALLAVADLACGLSTDPVMLYVFRGLAGVGGGGIANLAMIILSDVVELSRRGKYQGFLGATIGIGNVIGPFLAAGLLRIRGWTWHSFFFFLSPICILSGVLSYWLLPSTMGKKERRASTSRRVSRGGRGGGGGCREGARKIDYAGVGTSSLGIIFLLIPISGGGMYFAWDSPMVISMLVIGSLALVAFVFVEWKFANLPMMPISIFRCPAVSVMLAQSFLFGAVYQSYLYYVPLYLMNAHQYTPLTSAAILLAMVFMHTPCSILSGLYISHTKRYGEVIWFGFGVWTLGSGLTLILTRFTHPAVIVVPLALIGIGIGSIFQPTLVALQAHSPKSRRAVIISNRNFFRCAGSACGLAVSAAVLQAALRGNLPSDYAHIAEMPYARPDLSHASEADREQVLDAYMSASRAVFTLQVPMMVACLLGCFLIRDNGLAGGDGSSQALVLTDTEADTEVDTEAEVDEVGGQEEGAMELEECVGDSNNNRG